MDRISRLLQNFKVLRNKSEKESDPSLSFSQNWVNHVVTVLVRHRRDKDFSGDVLMSSMDYFLNKMTDQQKSDAFCVMMRKLVEAELRRR